MHILVKNNFLNYKNYKVKCALGKKGINYKKRVRDKKKVTFIVDENSINFVE